MPKGPSLDPTQRRLAVQVEDHPLEYREFEGTIPKGEYGGGRVMLWDRGTWEPLGDTRAGYRKGRLQFVLHGQRLQGTWSLIRINGRKEEPGRNWLLIKSSDEYATTGDPLHEQSSVAAGRTMEEIARHKNSLQQRNSQSPGTKREAKNSNARHLASHRETVSEIRVAGVVLTNSDRVLYPDLGVTKKELARFFESISDWILPHVTNRPISLVRCPAGWETKCFYQKHVATQLPQGMARIPIRENAGMSDYVCIKNLKGLIGAVQLGVLEYHPWGCRIDKTEKPDRLIFDLDPGPGAPWVGVIAGARQLRELLETVHLKSYVKTSGGKGLHVVSPITRTVSWYQLRNFAHGIVTAMARERPDRYLTVMTKSRRPGKIFIDYIRNGRGATCVAAYSTRARKGAPVSTPISWEELNPRLQSDKFTIRNLDDRLGSGKDPWSDFFSIRQSITESAMKQVAQLAARKLE